MPQPYTIASSAFPHTHSFRSDHFRVYGNIYYTDWNLFCSIMSAFVHDWMIVMNENCTETTNINDVLFMRTGSAEI